MYLQFSIKFLILSIHLVIVKSEKISFLNEDDIRSYCTTNTKIINNVWSNQTKFYDLRRLNIHKAPIPVVKNSETYLINICSTDTKWVHIFNGVTIGDMKYFTGFEQLNHTSFEMTFYNIYEDDELFKKNLGCGGVLTSITFTCNEQETLKNQIELIEKSKKANLCKYKFKWHTIEACGDQNSIQIQHFENEKFIFLNEDQKIDLNLIIRPEIVYFANGDMFFYVFLINTEETLKMENKKENFDSKVLMECKDSFVCLIYKTYDRISEILPIAKPIDTTLKYANDYFYFIVSSDYVWEENYPISENKTENLLCSVIFELKCDQNNDTITLKGRGLGVYEFTVANSKICDIKKPNFVSSTEMKKKLEKNPLTTKGINSKNLQNKFLKPKPLNYLEYDVNKYFLNSNGELIKKTSKSDYFEYDHTQK